jgi:hypothetical protein
MDGCEASVRLRSSPARFWPDSGRWLRPLSDHLAKRDGTAGDSVCHEVRAGILRTSRGRAPRHHERAGHPWLLLLRQRAFGRVTVVAALVLGSHAMYDSFENRDFDQGSNWQRDRTDGRRQERDVDRTSNWRRDRYDDYGRDGDRRFRAARDDDFQVGRVGRREGPLMMILPPARYSW